MFLSFQLFCVADTAVLAQSRFILKESIMMFFGLASLLCVIKFRKVSCPPSPSHGSCGCPYLLCSWQQDSGQNIHSKCHFVFLNFFFSVKYFGIYTSFLCTFLLFQDFWRLLPNKKLSDNHLLTNFVVRVSVLTLIPAIL